MKPKAAPEGLPTRNGPCHECAPKDWRNTPMVSGCYELDGMIARNKNKDVPDRLKMFADQSQNLYGPRTGYDGYHGYSGDD